LREKQTGGGDKLSAAFICKAFLRQVQFLITIVFVVYQKQFFSASGFSRD